MIWPYNVYYVLLLVAAAVVGFLALMVWRRRGARGRVAFTCMMASMSLWAFAGAMQLSASTLGGKLLWFWLQLYATPVMELAWPLFVLQYTERREWLHPRVVGAFSLGPLLVTLLLWSNSYHHLFFSSFSLQQQGETARLAFEVGVAFWANLAYFYFLLAGGTVLLLTRLKRSARLYRRQSLIVLVAICIPWSGDILHLSGLNPFRGVYLTPMTFSLMGLILFWGLFRYRLFDLVPIAREMLVANIKDGVVALDERRRIVDVNPQGQALLGRPLNELLGRELTCLSSFQPELVRCFLLEGHAQLEIVLRQGSRPLYYELQISPLAESGAGHLGDLLVLHDITSRKETEEELRQAKETAEAASRAKSTFLANMNHELRTPLTTILGYSQFLLEEAVDRGDEDLRLDVENIRAAGEHLMSIIGRILEFCNLEVGKVELKLASFTVESLIKEVVAQVRPQAEKQKNIFSSNISLGLGEMVADRAKVRHLLVHLLENACKFTRGGVVHFKVEVVERGGERIFLFSIQDTGIGMGKHERAHLFEPFGRAGKVTTRKEDGLGLGLVLSRIYCRMMGGEMVVESEEGRGTEVIVRLPAVVQKRPDIPPVF